MKSLNHNTPLSNYVYTIITEKNKQIKENILLGNIKFHDIIFYSNQTENNSLKSPSHLSFLDNLQRQKQLLEVREEKSNLEKKVSMVDNQLLSIKNNNIIPNNLNLNERYIYTNLNNSNVNNDNNEKNISVSQQIKNKSKSKSKKSLSSEKKAEKIISLPTLGKEKKEKNKMKIKNIYVKNIVLKPIETKSFKSNSKVNNHETEEKLEKDARAFIQKLNKNKQKELAKINKRQERIALKLKNEIEKRQRENQLKMDEYNYNNKNQNIFNNNNIYDYNSNNVKNYLRKYRIKNVNEYYQENSVTKKQKNKKYYHYSPYNYKNPKMLKNISKDLLNYNSELYYNNNIPDIIQYQVILAPFYKNNNMINKGRSTPYINVEDINNVYMNNNNNIPDIIDMTNGELISNNSRFNNNNYSSRIDESNMDSNIDNSFNKKHLYFFNEPKYEIENTSGENEINKTNEK